ncbi:response regulator transcription factor [Chloroflexota bacterium]
MTIVHLCHSDNQHGIADTLFVSENTVKVHLRNILDKLHVYSRYEAAMLQESRSADQLTREPLCAEFIRCNADHGAPFSWGGQDYIRE